MLKAMKSLHHFALSADIVLRSWQLSGLHPFDPNTPLKHPCILLKDEEQMLKIDSAGKGHGERHTISGKVITNLAEIESIRAIEEKKMRRTQAKTSHNQTPSDPVLIENPESALSPAPKRRGRPRKNVPREPVKNAPATAQ